MGMVGEACLPSNAYYPRTPDYTLCSEVHVCWSEHSDSSFVYGFMSLDYGFGTMTATTTYCRLHIAGYTYIGDVTAQVLRVMPFKQSQKLSSPQDFLNHYVHVAKSFIDQVHISIKGDTGYDVPFITGKSLIKLISDSKKINKRSMGHNLLTCIFANAMQQFSSIATATA